jgi:ADP-ribose pyrophosphatase YjhB (NUDIX family)
MERHHHYETGTYVRTKTFLPDEEYGRALDTLVKGCVDVLLRNARGQVLLGLRAHEPAKGDWWYIGGRMRCGETIRETARRHVTRDIGIDVDEGRFSFVTSSTMNWEFRVQPPASNGTCDVNVVMTATLTEDEVKRMKKCDLEYVEQRFWELEEVLEGAGKGFPMPIVNSTRRLLFCEAEDELFAAVRQGKSDAEVAALARAAFAHSGIE